MVVLARCNPYNRFSHCRNKKLMYFEQHKWQIKLKKLAAKSRPTSNNCPISTDNIIGQLTKIRVSQCKEHELAKLVHQQMSKYWKISILHDKSISRSLNLSLIRFFLQNRQDSDVGYLFLIKSFISSTTSRTISQL